ncbi:hypothetical protein XCR_0770 [Xanthomonas campestris pv. raphani 756C]|nr:hypothetical protein XCR_0770 [Xanthomonas campestris pv. raphani 756C]
MHKTRRQAVLPKALRIPCFEELTALITEDRRLDDDAAGQRRFDHFQWTAPRLANAVKYLP